MSKIYIGEHGWVGWDSPPTNRQESPWRMRYGGSGDTTFALPEYDGTLKAGGWTKEGTTAWENLDHGGDVVVVGSVYQDDSHLPPPAGTASKVQQIAADKYRPWSPKRRKKCRLGMERKYWTMGEVGNHCSDTDRWALVEDHEGGFQVQDVTDNPLLQTKHSLEKCTEMTQHGLVLHQDAHKWTLQNPPLSLLIMGKELQDLFEMDGQDGRPHWVYAGREIYDPADVPLATPEEMKDYLASPGNTRPRGATPSEMTALRSSHQGDAVTAADRHGISPDRLRSILTLACATIHFHRPPTRRPAYKAPGYAPFTIEALGCWIFPRQGRVYMAIDNIVYNIKDLASTHPGGSNLITALSGRHATLEFKRDHPHNWEVLLDGMEKVGHVVPTFSAERFAALRPDEVCFRDDCWVYRVTKQTFVRGMMEWTLDHRNTRTWGLKRWEEERRGFEGEFARSEPWLGRRDVDDEGGVGGEVCAVG